MLDILTIEILSSFWISWPLAVRCKSYAFSFSCVFIVGNMLFYSQFFHFYFYVQSSCILEFDGASKGNPGLAGAGAVLRAADGSMVYSFIWRALSFLMCLTLNFILIGVSIA